MTEYFDGVKDRIRTMDIKIVYICFLFLVAISFNIFTGGEFYSNDASLEDNKYIALIYFSLMAIILLRYRNRWTILFFTYATIMITPLVGLALMGLSMLMGAAFASYPFLFLISAFLLYINVVPKKKPHLAFFILFGVNFSALFFACFMALSMI